MSEVSGKTGDVAGMTATLTVARRAAERAFGGLAAFAPMARRGQRAFEQRSSHEGGARSPAGMGSFTAVVRRPSEVISSPVRKPGAPYSDAALASARDDAVVALAPSAAATKAGPRGVMSVWAAAPASMPSQSALTSLSTAPAASPGLDVVERATTATLVDAKPASFAAFAPSAPGLTRAMDFNGLASFRPSYPRELLYPTTNASANLASLMTPNEATALPQTWAPAQPAFIAEPITATPALPAAAPSAANNGGGPWSAMAPERSLAPPPSAMGQSFPAGGDVFLDGVRMGHWVSEHLAREAGRPQRGGTAFDPRLSARWPGSLQGG